MKRAKVWSIVFFSLAGFFTVYGFGQEPVLVVETGHSLPVNDIWLSRNEENLISLSPDRLIIWNVKEQRQVREIKKVSRFFVAQNEKVVAISNTADKNDVDIWEIKTGNYIFSINNITEWHFNSDGTKIISGDPSGAIKIWNASNGEILYQKQISATEGVKDCYLAPGDKSIVVILVDPTNPSEGAESINVLNPAGEVIVERKDIYSWQLSPDNKLLLIRTDSGTEVFDLNQPAKLVFGPKDFLCDLTPAKRHLLCVITSGVEDEYKTKLELINLETGVPSLSLDGYGLSDKYKFSENGKYFCLGAYSKLVIYEVATGKPVSRFEPPQTFETYNFSPDGELLEIVFPMLNKERYVIFWKISESREIFNSRGLNTQVYFNRDGKTVVLRNFDKFFQFNSKYSLSVYNYQTGTTIKLDEFVFKKSSNILINRTDQSGVVRSFNKSIVFGGNNGDITIWNLENAKKTAFLKANSSRVNVRPGANEIDIDILNTGNFSKIWDFKRGKIIDKFQNKPPEATVEFKDFYDESLKKYVIEDKRNGKMIFQLNENYLSCHVVLGGAYALCEGCTPGGVKPGINWCSKESALKIEIWNINQKKLIFSRPSDERYPVFSEQYIVLEQKIDPDENSASRTEVWDFINNQLQFSRTDIAGTQFTPSEDKIIFFRKPAETEFYNLEIYDLKTDELKLTIPNVISTDIDFSPDGKFMAVKKPPTFLNAARIDEEPKDYNLEIWDLTENKIYFSAENVIDHSFEWKSNSLFFEINGKIKWLDINSGKITQFQCPDETCPNLAVLISGTKNLILFGFSETRLGSSIYLANAKEKTIVPVVGHLNSVISAYFTKNERYLITSSNDGTVKIWSTDDSRSLLTLMMLGEDDWVVLDANGRFDASEGAFPLMRWQVGNDVISFEQLKERYYEPNLWQKVLGFNSEPLRDVKAFKSVLLPPTVTAIESSDVRTSIRRVKIKNRNGGIGRVQVFVNGREFIEDARDEKLRANPNLPEYVLRFDLKNAPVVAGQKPDVKVVAWNYDPAAKEKYKGYISSRGTDVIYLGDKTETAEPPTLYAIIGGVSDYKGTMLDLKFAAKDAEDIYQGIQIGGKNLFGVERMKIKLLSTGNNPDAVLPTKENFRKAFADFAAEAKPNDILFVYLSGHGTTLNFGSDTYYYLTQEASTTNREILSKDSQLLSGSTISSEELTNWHKSIKALKQVLILDTCAAGAIGSEFKIIEKKEISSDAKRAIERMKDRIGFHVLMGSAADAVSYEASQYGQGLLTYSLLQGMRGAALGKDGQIDVSLLFNYAADTVPNLAKNIGGIQRPEIRVPTGGASFAVGIIKTDAEKKAIPLANVKPLILKPKLQNKALGYDNLKLDRLLKEKLIETSFSGTTNDTPGKIVFVEADEMPGAILPAGSYEVENDIVRVKINLISNDNVLRILNVEGNKNKLAELVEMMVRQINDAAAEIRF